MVGERRFELPTSWSRRNTYFLMLLILKSFSIPLIDFLYYVKYTQYQSKIQGNFQSESVSILSHNQVSGKKLVRNLGLHRASYPTSRAFLTRFGGLNPEGHPRR